MMIKQTIVIKVSMPCAKSRAKAMEAVSRVAGVISMTITGDHKDRLEVVGEGVDAVCLVYCLRKKKFSHVDILLVEEVKDKKKEEKKEEKHCCPDDYCYCHPRPLLPMVLCEDNPAYSCSIM